MLQSEIFSNKDIILNQSLLNESSFLIYTSSKGEIKINVLFKEETIWLTQARIASLFGTKIPAISKHLSHIFTDGELSEPAVLSILETTASDGKVYKTKYYNLDAIIAVGYRVNSYEATQFRIWATKTLRAHLLDGYTINHSQILRHYTQFLETVEQLKLLLPKEALIPAEDILELVTLFAKTWISLEAFDAQTLPTAGVTQQNVAIAAQELELALKQFKVELDQKNHLGDLFGTEKSNGALSGIVGNVFQTIAGQDAYPSIEEKAAHLLYFIVKNHPFHDGNKRCGAFSFIWFLRKADFVHDITPGALATLTLLIAQSNPSDKERMVGLVLVLLEVKK